MPSQLKQQQQKIQNKIYERMVFKVLDITQWRTVIPERWETNKVSPMIIPPYCLERVSRPQHRVRNLSEAQLIPWVEEIKLSLGRPKQLELLGQSATGKRKPGDLHGVPHKYSEKYQLLLALERTSQKQKGNSTWCSYKMGNSLWDIRVEHQHDHSSVVVDN